MHQKITGDPLMKKLLKIKRGRVKFITFINNKESFMIKKLFLVTSIAIFPIAVFSLPTQCPEPQALKNVKEGQIIEGAWIATVDSSFNSADLQFLFANVSVKNRNPPYEFPACIYNTVLLEQPYNHPYLTVSPIVNFNSNWHLNPAQTYRIDV